MPASFSNQLICRQIRFQPMLTIVYLLLNRFMTAITMLRAPELIHGTGRLQCLRAFSVIGRHLQVYIHEFWPVHLWNANVQQLEDISQLAAIDTYDHRRDQHCKSASTSQIPYVNLGSPSRQQYCETFLMRLSSANWNPKIQVSLNSTKSTNRFGRILLSPPSTIFPTSVPQIVKIALRLEALSLHQLCLHLGHNVCVT